MTLGVGAIFLSISHGQAGEGEAAAVAEAEAERLIALLPCVVHASLVADLGA